MRILHPPLGQPFRLAATMRRIAWEDHTAHRGAVELESTGNSKGEQHVHQIPIPGTHPSHRRRWRRGRFQ
nr:MAG TPA: hypothetical protein [Caudoviricetes sp.]